MFASPGSRPDDARESDDTGTMTEQALLEALNRRLGRVHAMQRLGIERDHESQLFGQGLNYFHIENMPGARTLIATVLMATGLYWRGLRNAKRVELVHNTIASAKLPKAFDGFTILHLSDLHVDITEGAMERVQSLVRDIDCDICVLTGDYRGATSGSCDPTIAGVERIVKAVRGPVYGVLGNHDSIAMLPPFEAMGIRMLLNETETIARGGERLHLAGIDDAHFFRVDNIEKAASDIPHDEFSILLSHTPEIYRQAAHAAFDVLLSGHTHGGQICLPGRVAITLDSALPRRLGAGAWRYHGMNGYTSVGAGCSVLPVRFNCPPEITLHHLRSAAQ